MAIHATSTPMPAPQRGLLRAFAHPRAFAAQPVGNSDILPSHNPLSDPDSTAAQPCYTSGLAPEEALASTAPAGLLEPTEAAEARALHRRRRLGEALEYGFALLDALDLPPLALDVIDDAIAALDAFEAPDEDLEPYLAGYYNGRLDPTGECENDDEYHEDADPAEETSLETAGRGFVRCGADDDEDESSDEDDELGDEHAPEHVEWMFGPKRNAEAERQHFAAWLAAAEVAHACG